MVLTENNRLPLHQKKFLTVAKRSWVLEKKEKRMEERNGTCQEGMSKIKATNPEAWWRSNIKLVLQHFLAIKQVLEIAVDGFHGWV